MGINNPKHLSTHDSLSRVEYLKSDFRSKALIESVSIARANNNSEVDAFSMMDMVEDYSERLANGGFNALLEKYNEITLAGEGGR